MHTVYKTIPHHAGALTVTDVRVEPGQGPQHSPQSGHAHAAHAAETGAGWHGPQQVLLYLRVRRGVVKQEVKNALIWVNSIGLLQARRLRDWSIRGVDLICILGHQSL